jgi:hypothetical protein
MINDLTNKTKTSSMTNDMINDSAVCFNDFTTKWDTVGGRAATTFHFMEAWLRSIISRMR